MPRPVSLAPDRSTRRSSAARRRRPDRHSAAELERLLHVVARSDVPVLVTGETGTGKGYFAERLHAVSHRSEGPFVRMHCVGLEPAAVTSLLLGSSEDVPSNGEGGRAASKLPMPEGGTLFLDDVGELSPSSQAELLRAIETAIPEPRSSREGVRLVASSRLELEPLVRGGTFRADLYHRIAGHTFVCPPLRARREELGLLVRGLLARHAPSSQGDPPEIAADALAALREHDWPGNVRELVHVLACAALQAVDGVIPLAALPLRMRASPSVAAAAQPSSGTSALQTELERLERQRIVEALERCGGNQTRAARLLGMARRTLLKRLDAYQIRRPRTNGAS